MYSLSFLFSSYKTNPINMLKPTKDKMDKLIEEMAHFDPDNMEMGAKSLSELLVSGALSL